jgi:Fic family protein
MPNLHRLDLHLQQISPALLTEVAQIDELKGQWVAGARFNPQILARLKQSVLVTSTGASTRIEGAHLSDEDVEKLMRGIAIEKFADRDKQEVRGYFELLQNIFDSWPTLAFNEGTIKHFHQEILKYVEKDRLHRGAYKKTENKVHMVDAAGQSIGILFDTTPAYLTPSAMQELILTTQQALAEKTYHPLLVIGHFLVEFLQIHPFQDGNGRLSRILTNFLLLQAGYLYVPYVSHEKLIEDNKPAYYLALRTSQKTFGTPQETILPWLTFFLKIILLQSQRAVALLADEQIERTLSPKQLAVWRYLQTVTEATPAEMAHQTQVARPTVNQVLNRLLSLRKIERIGQGRGTRYRIVRA